MIEVHLIGYTSDLKHVVLDVDANEERGRYRLLVDGDLFATLDDLRQQRWEQGLDVGVWSPDDEDGGFDADEEFDLEGEDDPDDESVAPASAPRTEPDAVADASWQDEDDEFAATSWDHEDEADRGAWSGDRAGDVDVDEGDEDDLLLDLTAPTPEPEGATHSILPLDDESYDELFEEPSVEAADEGPLPAVRLVPAPPAWARDEDSADLGDDLADDLSDDRLDEVADDVAPGRVLDLPASTGPRTTDDVQVPGDDEAPAGEHEDALADGRDEGDVGGDEDEGAWDGAGDGDDWDDAAVGASDPDDVQPGASTGTRALDTDLPTALPSAMARRFTKEGIEVPSDARLGPAEIQAELRRGRSVRAVAKDAGTDVAWVQRWLEPIRAEQSRVIEQAQQLPVERRGQLSALPLVEAVDVRLRRRNVEPETANWEAVRRDDGTWRVSCRFTEKGRSRTASWTWERGETQLAPASELARELGWVDQRLARQR